MRTLFVVGALILALPAHAQDQPRDYCPARPGLAEPPCTIEPGRVSAEFGALDWQRDASATTRTDDFVIGDAVLRAGLGEHLEIGIAWQALAIERERDRAADGHSTTRGIGDVELSLKRNLASPDGSGFSVALKPYVDLPVGSGPGTAGDWGAGMIVPLSQDIGHGLALEFTGEAAAAPDDDGTGRHFSASAIAGIDADLTDAITTAVEVELLHDEDLGQGADQGYAALSLAWAPAKDWQFDIGGALGLNRAAADAALSFGVSHRF